MFRSAFALLFAVPLLAGAEPDKVAVRVVKYGDLTKVIRSYQGQVVLIDFWGIT